MALESMFYISQTVAAFAIVVSLLFVGLEVRHSNRESRHRTIQEALQNYRAARLSIIDNTDVARAWISGLQDFTTLDPVDKVRFLLTADNFLNNVQSFFCTTLMVSCPASCTSRRESQPSAAPDRSPPFMGRCASLAVADRRSRKVNRQQAARSGRSPSTFEFPQSRRSPVASAIGGLAWLVVMALVLCTLLQ